MIYCLVVLISKAGNSTLQETTVILPAETWEITLVYQNSDSTALWIHPYKRILCFIICSKKRLNSVSWSAANLKYLSAILNYSILLYLFITRWQNCVETGLQLTWSQGQPHIHKFCISGFKAADYKSHTYLTLMHSKGTWAWNFSTCGYFYPSWFQIHCRASHPNKLKFDGFKVKIIWNL